MYGGTLIQKLCKCIHVLDVSWPRNINFPLFDGVREKDSASFRTIKMAIVIFAFYFFFNLAPSALFSKWCWLPRNPSYEWATCGLFFLERLAGGRMRASWSRQQFGSARDYFQIFALPYGLSRLRFSSSSLSERYFGLITILQHFIDLL